MHRRSFLLCLTALAGCGGTTSTETDTPTEPPTAMATASPSPAPSGPLAAFSRYLDENAVAVRELARVDETVELRYVSAGERWQELSAEIGTIAGGFLREAERGWAVRRLDSTIVADDGTPLARWHARVAWLAEYRRGDITGDELSLKILNSLERVRGTPIATPPGTPGE
ncbi:hypothetical protein [Natronomonas sp. EA1]|uniref:hypothetical protein n=1 Tax=Natronomonas sp. EA1 TaxID=3421655 RepID=UPI003EBCE28D